MKIIVTGSTGFIGKHLVQRLKVAKHEVVEWDRAHGKDIKDFSLAGIPSGVDMVVHLAAIADVRRSLKEPQLYWKTNVEYSKKIFDLCHRNDIPVVYASSSCVHAWWKSPYGTSKKAMEAIAHPGQVGLRFTTVFGKGARDTMLMSRIANGTVKFATEHVRDLIYVEDVVSAIMIFIQNGTKDKNPTYEVGTGEGYRVSDIVRYAGFDVPIQEGQDAEADDNTADNTELRKLGWQPTMSPKEWIDIKIAADYTKSIAGTK
tara:strand:- start:10290 stop:11069 length:780 start_codon:yes stop_codon:yes gene_type:complete